MPRILGFRVKNYRVLKDVTLGRFWDAPQADPLTPLTAVIGKNGAGKSALFDAFGFLADCLKSGVEEACEMRGRGGLERIRSQGVDAPIEFALHYRQTSNSRPITYELAVALDGKGRPCVVGESLRQRRGRQTQNRPCFFLKLETGKGFVVAGESQGIEDTRALRSNEFPPGAQRIELSDRRGLAIATLGTLVDHPRIASLRDFVAGWYFSYFSPNAARGSPMVGSHTHLSERGDNLGNVVQFMQRDHPRRFEAVLGAVAKKIPGIERIETTISPDGRLLLRFNDHGFKEPFLASQMSDGTLKMLAYLLLLNDPRPPPFICIEEPENGIHHKLLEVLAAELRSHADQGNRARQVFVTTHQPYFVNALKPEEIWIVEKQGDGFAHVSRASDDATVVAMTSEGLPLGGLWYSDYLD